MCAAALLFLLAYHPDARADQRLDEIRLLQAGGADDLALGELDEYQPTLLQDPVRWGEWERQRVAILEAEGDWPTLRERLAAAPPVALSAELARWRGERLVEAEIHLAQPALARTHLAELIWRQPPPVDAAWLRAQRMRLIRAYLLEGRAADAYSAALQYRLDYRPDANDADWNRMFARVLLANGEPAAAAEQLAGATLEEDRVTRTIALSRASQLRYSDLEAAAAGSLIQPGLAAASRYDLWVELARAAAGEGRLDAHAGALESALALQRAVATDRVLTRVEPGMLWRAYADLAKDLANRHQLLVGAYADWLELGLSLAPREPLSARALLAYLVTGGADVAAAVRDPAGIALVDLLRTDRALLEVLRSLTIDSEVLSAAARDRARYAIAGQAVEERDFALARRLMDGLLADPAADDSFAWRADRARLMILAGQTDEGINLLHALLRGGPSADERERIARIVTDLRAAGRLGDAYELFERLQDGETDPARRRELLVAMADTQVSAHHDAQAAGLYLRAAALAPDGPAGARGELLQAAAALTRAGLLDDAGRVYARLLDASDDPEQRAALLMRIDRLLPRASALPGAAEAH